MADVVFEVVVVVPFVPQLLPSMGRGKGGKGSWWGQQPWGWLPWQPEISADMEQLEDEAHHAGGWPHRHRSGAGARERQRPSRMFVLVL